jgi:hypothetical protein
MARFFLLSLALISFATSTPTAFPSITHLEDGGFRIDPPEEPLPDGPYHAEWESTNTTIMWSYHSPENTTNPHFLMRSLQEQEDTPARLARSRTSAHVSKRADIGVHCGGGLVDSSDLLAAETKMATYIGEDGLLLWGNWVAFISGNAISYLCGYGNI